MSNLNGLVRATQVPVAETEALKRIAKPFKNFSIKIKEMPNWKYTIYFNEQQKISFKKNRHISLEHKKQHRYFEVSTNAIADNLSW